MRTFILCLTAVAAHAATTVYQASVDQLTVVHGAAAADSAIPLSHQSLTSRLPQNHEARAL